MNFDVDWLKKLSKTQSNKPSKSIKSPIKINTAIEHTAVVKKLPNTDWSMFLKNSPNSAEGIIASTDRKICLASLNLIGIYFFKSKTLIKAVSV